MASDHATWAALLTRGIAMPTAVADGVNDVGADGSGPTLGRLVASRVTPARPARTMPWPAWVAPEVVRAFIAAGIAAPWTHQVEAADLAWGGTDVCVATSTASGKSLAYLMPGLTTITTAHAANPRRRSAVVLYLAPTKALAHDQLRALGGLRIPGLAPAAVDGDTDREVRDWAAVNASFVATNPDLVHRSMLPRHDRWARLLAAVTHVVVDEAHHYRGLFGAHTAAVLRRLLRVCGRYGADPVVVFCSATLPDPARTCTTLLGRPVTELTDDGSPHGSRTDALWLPGQVAGHSGRPRFRSASDETAGLLAGLVAQQVSTVAFVRSRHQAERVAAEARQRLRNSVDPADAERAERVTAYRAGYLADERRRIEADLRAGRLLGVAATSALELGVDIAGLDAVVTAGYPGSHASLRQQAGRAGRSGRSALAVLVAGDNPLDAYFVDRPDELFDGGAERTVIALANRQVLAAQLCAAAQELPLTSDEVARVFGDPAVRVLDELVAAGLLRRRGKSHYWTRPDSAAAAIDIRGSGGSVDIVETGTGRVIGSAPRGSACASLHPGAVYLHAGETWVIDALEFTDDHATATATAAVVDYTTMSRRQTDSAIRSRTLETRHGAALASTGMVALRTEVTSYLQRSTQTGEVLAEHALDLPAQHLVTEAAWWCWPDEWVTDRVRAGELIDPAGAAHALEHAMIGLLPLLAVCDPGDVGGRSIRCHPDTGRLTLFVHDSVPGGAGLATAAFERREAWLEATATVLAGCPCVDGCPRCVQSPRCGNNNACLDKHGALTLARSLVP